MNVRSRIRFHNNRRHEVCLEAWLTVSAAGC
jgi:hypothetical protein